MPPITDKVGGMELSPEEQVELLKRQLEELTGSSPEVGAIMSIGHGMTIRLATILCIFVKRAPAVVSKNALHSIFYGDQSDGGPEPNIFSNYVSRIRAILHRVGCPGEIVTVWNSGWKADPQLARWVRDVYRQNATEEK